jgi:hypothetical protein
LAAKTELTAFVLLPLLSIPASTPSPAIRSRAAISRKAKTARSSVSLSLCLSDNLVRVPPRSSGMDSIFFFLSGWWLVIPTPKFAAPMTAGGMWLHARLPRQRISDHHSPSFALRSQDRASPTAPKILPLSAALPYTNPNPIPALRRGPACFFFASSHLLLGGRLLGRRLGHSDGARGAHSLGGARGGDQGGSDDGGQGEHGALCRVDDEAGCCGMTSLCVVCGGDKARGDFCQRSRHWFRRTYGAF